MSSLLTDVLTLRTIQELGDARTFARGMAYFHGGAVELLDADEYEARASVQVRSAIACGSLPHQMESSITSAIARSATKESSASTRWPSVWRWF